MPNDIETRAKNKLIEIGVTIAQIRKLQGITQEKLAEKADISINELRLIESPNCDGTFSMEILFNIAKALGISEEKILKGHITI